MSFNKITIVGHLGKDPELRYSQNGGMAVCNLSVATSEKRKDRAGEMREYTTWFRVTFFGRLAELCNEHLAKGRMAYIEGRLRTEEYTDRDGNKRVSLEVNGTEVQFLGDKGNGGQSSQRQESSPAPPKQSGKPKQEIDPEDDIPF